MNFGDNILGANGYHDSGKRAIWKTVSVATVQPRAYNAREEWFVVYLLTQHKL